MSAGALKMAGSWAFRSISFHRARSFLTISAIGLATALVAGTLAFQDGYRASLRRNIDGMGYQVLVTGKGCPHEAATLILRGGSIPMYIRQEVYENIVGRPEVKDATRFFMQSVPLDGGRAAQLFVGIDDDFLGLRPGVTFQRGGWFSSGQADEAILGYNVAELRRLNVGDDLQVQRRKVKVTGILDKLGTQDDGTVFLPLETAQSYFDRRDQLTGIGIRLKDISQASELVNQLYDIPSIQVVRMAQVQTMILTILDDVRGLLTAFGALCLLVALMGVFNVALISAHERAAEMGILRALGCPAGRLFGLVWGESFALGLLGVAAGGVLLFALGPAIERGVSSMLTFVPAGGIVTFSPGLLLVTAAAVIPLCLLAGLYPAWRSSRVPPLLSIRGVA